MLDRECGSTVSVKVSLPPSDMGFIRKDRLEIPKGWTLPGHTHISLLSQSDSVVELYYKVSYL